MITFELCRIRLIYLVMCGILKFMNSFITVVLSSIDISLGQLRVISQYSTHTHLPVLVIM